MTTQNPLADALKLIADRAQGIEALRVPVTPSANDFAVLDKEFRDLSRLLIDPLLAAFAEVLSENATANVDTTSFVFTDTGTFEECLYEIDKERQRLLERA